MNRNTRFLWMAMGLAAVFCFLQMSCASSEAEPECTEDFECNFGETCNTELGVCEELRPSNNGNPNNGNPNNGNPNNGTPDSGNNGTPDAGNNGTPDIGNNGTPDVGEDTSNPNTCSPACGAGQHCENGSCVDDTTTGGCTQKGDTCDPQTSDQGSFWCVGDGNGGGTCLPKCTETFSAQGCATGEYCWNIGSQADPAPACIESDCQVDADCTNGACLNFDNQFGICITGGSTPEGQSCDPNASSNECATGTFCHTEPSGSNTGVCRGICDPWGASTCPSGQACNLFTNRDGLCSPKVENPENTQAYTQCTDSANLCTDGVPCVGFVDGTNGCMPYCRTGMNDCPPPPSGSTGTVVCNNYVSPGDHTWGICLGACASSADCSTGSTCQGGICRTQCSTGNEVQDCCDGQTPCDWTCVNGLCE